MNLVFLGPPGAGKGTVAKKVTERFFLVHISTGDLFREAIRNENPLGLQIKSVLAAGKLVTDAITIEMVRQRLAKKDTKSGFILDGFPRTIAQGEALLEMVPIDHVVNFVLDESTIVKRLSGRRICKSTGKTYHILYNPPLVDGIDDETGEELIQREDDREEAILQRIAVYEKETAPLIEFFKERALLRVVDAQKTPQEVFQQTAELTGLV
ncbi:MAG: adenylate kinase [Sphaerochaetaceae bacterium]